MKISVVTAAYNSAATIGYTIDSFLAQTWEDAELIVVDGASPDGTADIARGYDDPRIRVFSEPDKGLYDAFNKGFLHYTGDAIGYLNSDDRYHDAHALAAIAGALDAHDVVHGHLDFVADHASARVVRRWRATPWRPGGFQRGWMAAHPTFYVRRAVAERVGEFDRAFRIAGDYDFMIRALALDPSVRVGLVDRVLVDMMVGGVSTGGLGAYVKGNLESLRSRRRWLGAGVVDRALLAKPLGKLGQFLSRG